MAPLGIIPTFCRNSKHLDILSVCLGSIERTAPDLKVLVVDDCSPLKDEVKDIVWGRDNFTHYQREENGGFSRTVNIGLKKCVEEKRDAILINSDIEFRNDYWLEEMEKTEADIIGALLLYPNSLIQHAGVFFSLITRSFDHRFRGAPANLSYALKECECPVTAALMMIRYQTLEEVGLFDETFRLSFEDVDYNLRALLAGKKSLYNPKINAFHHESIFRGNSSEKHDRWQRESYIHLMRKYDGVSFYGIAPSMREIHD